MKRRIMLLAFVPLLIGSNIYAAGDLTVDGNLTVGSSAANTGLIVADKTFQCQSNMYNSLSDVTGGWKRVGFTPYFAVAPVVIANGDKSTSSVTVPFFVYIRNVTNTGFEFKFFGHDGVAVTAGQAVIHWCAIVSTQ